MMLTDLLECLRKEVDSRLKRDCHMKIRRLPLTAGPEDPHVPVYVSDNFESCKYLILFVGDKTHGAGVLSFEYLQRESISRGSLVEIIHFIRNSPRGNEIGIVIANPNQTLWSKSLKRAVDWGAFSALERRTAVSPAPSPRDFNYIPYNGDPAQHILCLTNDLLRPKLIKGATMSIITFGNAAELMIDCIQRAWYIYKRHLVSVVIAGTTISFDFFNRSDFRQFWEKVWISIHS
jgi:hypothetical protein